MPIMDVFKGDAFSARSLTAAVDRYDYVPGYLGAIPNLFIPKPVRTKEVWIEERDFGPRVIQTSPRGAAPSQRGGEQRRARAFETTRIADASRVWADEIQNVRAFGEEMAVKDLQMEVGRRQMKMKQDFDLTKEHMRLGAVQGVVVDADGTVLYDWFEEFGQTEAAAIEFNLTKGAGAAEDGSLLIQTNEIRRGMLRDLKGMGGTGVVVHALCGDEFWDGFVTLPEVRETYKFAMQALALQNDVGGAWESFRYGKIMWHNYRGTDDNSTVAVPSGTVKFFPSGANVFHVAQAPAEKFEFVNTPGQEDYSWIVHDKDRDMWVDVEQYSYPLHVCVQPKALRKGVIA